jgi:cardiolipin synthase A/B
MTTAEWISLAASLLHMAAAAAVTFDAVLRKRHVPSVIGWVGLAWLAPLVGSALYFLFGINRIKRSLVAQAMKAVWESDGAGRSWRPADADAEVAGRYPQFAGLVKLGHAITGSPLAAGNRVRPLRDGDEAYPAMLSAISDAGRSITLATYIFDHDDVGLEFLRALAAAQQRGVQVRVLIDDVGVRYSRANMVRELRRAGVTAASFLPTRAPWRAHYANLRMHRKILVVDGRIGFTGGMNIRSGHWLARAPRYPVQCLHFELQGPIVGDLQRTFATDWAYTTGEQLYGEPWLGPVAPAGSLIARGVPDGPDHDLDNMLHLMLGALSLAQRSVRIVTPYFLPDGMLLGALKITAMRGVAVDLVLPERNNIRVMDWAVMPQLPDLIDKGCRVHFSPPPFDHTKLFIVDDIWSLIGSTNWDARSLRLNFEFNVECYDDALALELATLVEQRIAKSRLADAAELRARPMAERLRNGVARLLSPYL